MLVLLHALISCLAAYILPCFPTFWHYHPYILQHFNGNVFTPLFHWFFVVTVYSFANTFMRAPPHFAARDHVKCTWVIMRKWHSTTRK